MMMKKIKVYALLVCLLAASTAQAQSFGSAAMRKLQMAEFAISNFYVDKVDEDKLVEEAIIKMLAQLDPHSTYSDAEEVKKMNEPLQGNFEGIGVQFQMIEDTLLVVQPVSNGPSEKVGILAGDRIIAVNDIDRELDDKELESWIRLTRVLTHEIMNAVTPVMSLSDTLLRLHGNRDDDTYRGLEAIHATSKSLISFVESYRSFTRIPAPEMELLDVRKFLERIVMLVSRQIEEQHIRVDIRVEPEDLILYADGNQITQVILNLLKNAAGAIGTREGGVIALSAFCNDEEHVIVDVANNGEPISEEVSQHIFVPFFTTKEHGSGIGLSVSRQIMRMHNGSIMLKHSLAGKTTFMLLFN